MQPNSKLRFLISFLLVTIVALSSVQSALASGPAPDPNQARFEVHFMQKMIDHHTMAIEMSEVCLERAIHDPLRSMCEKMIMDQMQEIEKMQTWLMNWYGVSYSPQMDQQDQQKVMKLMNYEGETFEIRFMQMMIQHHKKAIRMSETCLEKAYHPRLLNLCGKMIETQSQEIAQMRTWLCEWYDRCGAREEEG